MQRERLTLWRPAPPRPQEPPQHPSLPKKLARRGRSTQGCSDTHRRAHHVAQAEVEAALLVHGVVQPWELGQRWPVVGKGVVPQAVIGAVRGHVGATSSLQRGASRPYETAAAPSGVMVGGLFAHYSPQPCCLSFPAASLFLDVSSGASHQRCSSCAHFPFKAEPPDNGTSPTMHTLT